jgi:hypothetical protein
VIDNLALACVYALCSKARLRSRAKAATTMISEPSEFIGENLTRGDNDEEISQSNNEARRYA